MVIYNYYYYFFYLIFTKHLKATADCLKRHKVGKEKLLRVANIPQQFCAERKNVFVSAPLFNMYIYVYTLSSKTALSTPKTFPHVCGSTIMHIKSKLHLMNKTKQLGLHLPTGSAKSDPATELHQNGMVHFNHGCD